MGDNCIIYLEDLAAIANDWLGGYDIEDFAGLASTWMIDYSLDGAIEK